MLVFFLGKFRVKQIVIPGIQPIRPVTIEPPETSLSIILLHHSFSICKRASHTSFKATNYHYCILYSNHIKLKFIDKRVAHDAVLHRFFLEKSLISIARTKIIKRNN